MAVDMEKRNTRIKADLKDGKTIAEVAEKYELSTARVWKVANDYKEKPRSQNGKSKHRATPRKKAAKTTARKATKARKPAHANGNGKIAGKSLTEQAAAVQGGR